MTCEAFSRLLFASESPVVLLEGTRALPASDAPKLTALATRMAREFPTARFRTGNATGSDAAFAAGVAGVDPARVEYILPYAGHRKSQRSAQSPAVAVDEVSAADLDEVVITTIAVSPQYQRTAERYRDQVGSHRERAIAQLILRDTLKVTGGGHMAQPTAGIFYVNAANPDGGGTGHTMRVCRARDVPVITQFEWMAWAV